MKKNIYPVLIVLALAVLFLAGIVFFHKTDTSEPNGTIEGRVIDAQPRKGAEGLNIAFLHPKSTCGILTELCEHPE